jgi:hypothetical protein
MLYSSTLNEIRTNINTGIEYEIALGANSPPPPSTRQRRTPSLRDTTCAPRTQPRRSRPPGHSQSKSLSMFITPNGIRAFIIRHWFCARGSVREISPPLN